MRARMLLVVPVLSFVTVLVVTLAYDRVVDAEDDAVAQDGAPAVGTGRLIVALERNPGVRLYSVALDGSGGRFITDESARDAGAILVEAHPDWSPETGRIVFTRYEVENGEPDGPRIWTVGPDGSDAAQLTHGPWPDFLPAWSPDGARIAFTRELRGSAEIFVMDADGSDVTQLTHSRATHDEHPAWSPDGTRIAFHSAGRRNQDLFVVNADGTEMTQITDGPFLAADPAWSPDGTQIAFVCDADLCLVGAEQGSRPAQVLGSAAREFSPRWSPDGKWIAFARDPGVPVLLGVATKKTVRVPLEGTSFSLSWGPRD